MTDDLAEAKRHIRALMKFIDHVIDEDMTCGYGSPFRPQEWIEAQAFLDAEGQTVEGGENLPCPICGDLPKEQDYREHTDQTGEVDGYASVSCVASDHNVLCDADNLDEARKAWNRRAELTRLKSAQAEHDRTVRLAALEEAAIVAMDRNIGRVGGFGNDCKRAEAITIAHKIRSLIDQTGGEGGI